MPKTVSLHTLGCKLNYSETSTLAKKFSEKGLQLKEYGEKSDIFVLNTCTVTANADRECRQIIRSVLRNNPETYVIVTGCYAQLQPGEIAEIDGVDLILGSEEKFRMLEYLENIDINSPSCIFKENTARIFVKDSKSFEDVGEAFSADSDSRTRAFLKIQDGCDYNCTFCTIPLARGESRSLDYEKVIENAKRIIDSGYKEIILTGVNTGDYEFRSNGKKYELIDVLYGLNELNIKRIRISSIEPNLLTDDIINLVKTSDKFCKHFHIPLQSGDTEILKLMKRRYNLSLFSGLISKINSEIDNAGIGIDVIVGFPGETEENFANTYNFIDKLGVSYLHVFTYSERKNTPAVMLPGKVDVSERKKRSTLLRNLSLKKKFGFYEKNWGKIHTVLFESKVITEGNKEYVEGWTSNYIRVRAVNDTSIHNEIKDVRLGYSEGVNPVYCEILKK